MERGRKEKMDHKAIRTALVAVMVFSVFIATALPASASATADSFGAENANGFKNTNVFVLVNITNVHSESIAGIEFEFLYNSSVINLAEIQKGALISQWSEPVKKGTEGDYVIAIVGSLSTAITNGSTGSVAVLKFSVIGEPREISPMNLTDIKLINTSFDQTGTAPAKNGTFTILTGPGPTPTPSPSPTEPPSSGGGGGGGGGGEETVVTSTPSLTLTPAPTLTVTPIPTPTANNTLNASNGDAGSGNLTSEASDTENAVQKMPPQTSTSTPTENKPPSHSNSIPGFDAISALVGLLFIIAYLLRRKTYQIPR